MATYKVKYATRNKLARALQQEVRRLGLIDTGALYDSLRISAMTGEELNKIDITIVALYYYLFQDKGAILWNGGFIEPQNITELWLAAPRVQAVIAEIAADYIQWQFQNYPLLQMAKILNNPTVRVGFDLYGDPSGKWNLKIAPATY
jgi:hypothetical protein